MADDDRDDLRVTSIVPYRPTSREVVLRHNDAVITYDPHVKQLVLQNASQGQLDLTECPTCHQSLRREGRARSQEQANQGPNQSTGFVHPAYFRLHQSLYGSRESSPPPSPQRRLVEPVRSPQSSPRGLRQAAYVDSPPASPSSTTGTDFLQKTPSVGIAPSAFSPGYFQSCYVVEKELGRGGKGVVLLVTHMLDENPIGKFACKRVPVGDDREWLKRVLEEVQLLQWLKHKHLVQYHHVWLEEVQISKFAPSVPCAFILQQYCNAGDLHDYVVHSVENPPSTHQLKESVRRRSKHQLEPMKDLRGRKLQFEEIYSIFKGIVSGLNHLHVNGYIHRDLKPSNCLLHDEGDGHGLQVLVSDFGEAQVENMVRKSTGATGTISYCAPEVLRRDSSGVLGNFTKKSDIFSLGMILYFLCFARLPYRHADIMNEENEDLDHLREEITTWTGLHSERQLRPDLPEQLYTFLRRLLSLHPNDRPSAEDILLSIKTSSGLDGISDARSRTAGHMFEDLRNDSRISPVDSPRPSTPIRKLSIGYGRANGPAKLRRPRSLQREHSCSPTPNGAEDDDENNEATSPGGSLVLRRDRFPSPMKLPELPQLTAPPSSGRGYKWNVTLHSPAAQRTLKIALLLVKVISVNLPCSPMAANPWAAYPLVFLASIDVLLGGSHQNISLTLVVLHVAILSAMAKTGVLCRSARPVWEEF